MANDISIGKLSLTQDQREVLRVALTEFHNNNYLASLSADHIDMHRECSANAFEAKRILNALEAL